MGRFYVHTVNVWYSRCNCKGTADFVIVSVGARC